MVYMYIYMYLHTLVRCDLLCYMIVCVYIIHVHVRICRCTGRVTSLNGHPLEGVIVVVWCSALLISVVLVSTDCGVLSSSGTWQWWSECTIADESTTADDGQYNVHGLLVSLSRIHTCILSFFPYTCTCICMYILFMHLAFPTSVALLLPEARCTPCAKILKRAKFVLNMRKGLCTCKSQCLLLKMYFDKCPIFAK